MKNSSPELALLEFRLKGVRSDMTEPEVRRELARAMKLCGLYATREGTLHVEAGRWVVDGWSFALVEQTS